MLDILHDLELFGRGGGGGSGGGSGSGGGGSAIVLIGYVPTHFIGAIARRKLPFLAANLIVWPLALFYAGLLLWTRSGFGILAGIAALIGAPAGLYNWFDRVAKLSQIAKKKQALALQKDSIWDTAALNQQVAAIFNRYQADWSDNNTTDMQSYMTPWYFYHNQLMMLALSQLGRRNIVAQPTITSLALVDITDAVEDSDDRFIMLVSANANDTLHDTQGRQLFVDRSAFQEYWRFVRNGQAWLLEGIGQVTEDPYMRSNGLALFAQAHQYCYSPDWGWLLLPARGQLFKSGKFGTSDINNHVIGMYRDTLIQLYTYSPSPKQAPTKTYLIAQVAVPKQYGNIVVRTHRQFRFGIRGLTRVTLEWGDFNKRYEVWASDLERVTSFELLNPSFMTFLQAVPFEVNIEVVDNIIFFYSLKTSSSAANYELLLELLYKAFAELRM